MIDRSDVLLLLADLSKTGVDTKEEIRKLYSSSTIPLSALKLINNNRTLDLVNFYDKLRKAYNDKKSKLYINIMRSNENTIKDANTVLTTLSALLNQILQYKCEDKRLFIKHARADEIANVIAIYADTFDIDPAYKLLTLFKADILALETVSGHRS